jgi:hypothetical protein
LRALSGIEAADGCSAVDALARSLDVEPGKVLSALVQRGDDTVAALVRALTREQGADTRSATPTDSQQEASA